MFKLFISVVVVLLACLVCEVNAGVVVMTSPEPMADPFAERLKVGNGNGNGNGGFGWGLAAEISKKMKGVMTRGERMSGNMQ